LVGGVQGVRDHEHADRRQRRRVVACGPRAHAVASVLQQSYERKVPPARRVKIVMRLVEYDDRARSGNRCMFGVEQRAIHRVDDLLRRRERSSRQDHHHRGKNSLYRSHGRRRASTEGGGGGGASTLMRSPSSTISPRQTESRRTKLIVLATKPLLHTMRRVSSEISQRGKPLKR